MSDLVGNPEDRFSHNEAHFTSSSWKSIGVFHFALHNTFYYLKEQWFDFFGPEATLNMSIVYGLHVFIEDHLIDWLLPNLVLLSK